MPSPTLIPGAPCWIDLYSSNTDAATTFYGRLLGWSARDVFGWEPRTMSDTPEFRYTTLGEGDDALAGIMDDTSSAPEGSPAGWSVYFRVDDTDAALERVVELGGTVVEPAVDTPYGRLAQAADPTGVVFRLVAN